jgi:hypothetical protein
MSIKQFNQAQNIRMLWDLISEEEIFKYISPDVQSKIYHIFLNNIPGFVEAEKTKMNTLVEINKKYIFLIISYIKKNYPYQPSKITIYDESEEIQKSKKSKFENDFIKKQAEFEDSINIKMPPVPEFAEKNIDKPIKEMDKILKKMQAQRNYEVEYTNTNTNANQWLTSQKTSLKNEKFEQHPEQIHLEKKKVS